MTPVKVAHVKSDELYICPIWRRGETEHIPYMLVQPPNSLYALFLTPHGIVCLETSQVLYVDDC